MTEQPPPTASPTASIRTVLLSLGGSAVIGLLLGAQGVVHAGHGMADGPERSVTLAVGNSALTVSRDLRLTGLWDTAQAALGRPRDVTTPPLLASASTAVPVRTTVPAARPDQTVRRPVLLPVRAVHPVRSGRTRSSRPLQGTVHAVQRRPSRKHPLRVLITGDSLPGYLGPQLLNGLAPGGRVKGWTEVHDGTGLTRPDYVDWSVVARQEVKRYAPEVTIVLMGGNDFQNMVLPNGKILYAGTPAWTAEYARRAAICMRIWVRGQGGHRVYWLSMPPARDPRWAYDFSQINRAIQMAAARVPGAEYVNVLRPITANGRYADYVRVAGQYELIREPDGVHLNMAGSQIVARELMSVLRRDWRV